MRVDNIDIVKQQMEPKAHQIFEMASARGGPVAGLLIKIIYRSSFLTIIYYYFVFLFMNSTVFNFAQIRMDSSECQKKVCPRWFHAH